MQHDKIKKFNGFYRSRRRYAWRNRHNQPRPTDRRKSFRSQRRSLKRHCGHRLFHHGPRKAQTCLQRTECLQGTRRRRQELLQGQGQLRNRRFEAADAEDVGLSPVGTAGPADYAVPAIYLSEKTVLLMMERRLEATMAANRFNWFTYD